MKDGVPQADGSMAVEPTMDVEHVARTIVYMASLPLDANVQFITVMATQDAACRTWVIRLTPECSERDYHHSLVIRGYAF